MITAEEVGRRIQRLQGEGWKMSNISLGIYTPEVACKNAAELFQRVRGFGFSEVQFDFLSVMDEEMPLHIPDALALECRAEA